MTTATLTGGRGWLAADAAASIHRIDADLGHRLQITEAGRSAARADANYAAYQAYLRGGPWAPLAYPAGTSRHVPGYAIDSDEAQQHLDLMARHGWRRTVYRGGVLVEPWHFEYLPTEDKQLGSTPAPATTEAPTTEETPDMFIIRNKATGDCFMADTGRLRHIGSAADLAAARTVFPFRDVDDRAFRVALIGLGIPYSAARRGADYQAAA